ncbi:hypothetical protein AGMMS50218_15300 [Actinomycetota bacterium]|nr:hypothetical protein AGMMS50218_15300 [Actinomycetota bacterium]
MTRVVVDAGGTGWMTRAWCATREAVAAGLEWVSEDPGAAQDARDACLVRCPVLSECRTWVLAVEGPAAAAGRGGIWAGHSPADRERLWIAARRAQDKSDDTEQGARP